MVHELVLAVDVAECAPHSANSIGDEACFTPRQMQKTMSPHAETNKYLVAHFTKRDLILYALGIGCGSGSDNQDDDDNNNRELRFVNEENIEVFPSFLLSLLFVAERDQQQHFDDGIQRSHSQWVPSFGIRSFPPEAMTHYLEDGTKCGLLPKHFFLSQDIDLLYVQSLPILHVSQSLKVYDEIKLTIGDEHHNSIDPSTQLRLQTRIISVEPRNKGTFVTSETTYYQFGKCIASAQMVAMIVGLDKNLVVPWKATPNEPFHMLESGDQKNRERGSATMANEINSGISNKNERTEVRYCIPTNAALLYRLSGDYNPIHVQVGPDDSDTDSPANGYNTIPSGRRPVLHGLCTLGYALRGVLRHVDGLHRCNGKSHSQSNLISFQCNFIKPVFLNDSLCIETWNNDIESHSSNELFRTCFCVYREVSQQAQSPRVENEIPRRVMVLDGTAEFRCKRPCNIGRVKSRL